MMSRNIYIDPGYSVRSGGCAVSVFEGFPLAHVFFMARGRAAQRPPCLADVQRVVWELPQMDDRSRSTPPNVLIQLTAEGATLAGTIAGWTGNIVARTPSQWKGSSHKPSMHLRAWDVLTEPERRLLGGPPTLNRIEAAVEKGAADRWARPGGSYYPITWNMHNLLDAVCMGLIDLGRMQGR